MQSSTFLNRGFRVFISVFQGFIRLFGKRFYWKFFPRLVETIDLVYKVKTPTGKEINFYCGGELARYRAETLFTKEPATIRWIETFDKNDVFLDVGANIGVYTLYAAIQSECQVIAVEPTAANFANLSRNIQINNIGNMVYPFCMAAHDSEEISSLFMHSGGLKTGGSGAVFGTSVNNEAGEMDVQGIQHTMGYSIDSLLKDFNLPFPNHFKMDILGTQEKVILGARQFLKDPRLKSAMIEIPNIPEKILFIQKEMKDAGFIHDESYQGQEGDFFFKRP